MGKTNYKSYMLIKSKLLKIVLSLVLYLWPHFQANTMVLFISQHDQKMQAQDHPQLNMVIELNIVKLIKIPTSMYHIVGTSSLHLICSSNVRIWANTVNIYEGQS